MLRLRSQDSGFRVWDVAFWIWGLAVSLDGGNLAPSTDRPARQSNGITSVKC